MAAPRRVVPPTSSTTTRVVWVAEHLTIGPALMISRITFPARATGSRRSCDRRSLTSGRPLPRPGRRPRGAAYDRRRTGAGGGAVRPGILKILAARPKDSDDLTALLGIHRGSIDESRVRRVLAMLASALGQIDLLAAFEAALEESET